ncbi:MAG: hypothetical protein M3P30_10595 [Chloroflexota bacterium]|nr:hypothetical protein [Chloroflexota bacterium]
MKRYAVAAVAFALIGAGAALIVELAGRGGSPDSATALVVTPAPAASPSPFPLTWIEGLDHPTGSAILISCFDSNRDGRIDAGDGASLDGLDIPLLAGKACDDPARHRDFYAGEPLTPAACEGGGRPLLIVAIASGGSDLLDATAGESTGILRIVNELQTRAADAAAASEVVLSTAAVFGAEEAQTHMEHWLAHYVGQRLEAVPCLRAVFLGHSHGGVTVTSVTASLDGAYGERMLGVAIDRTTALYDRPAAEYPSVTTILNVYQTNEGWHGEPVIQSNVINDDESAEQAPVALSDGGGGLAAVGHKTLDDSPGVQRRIEDAVMGWLRRGA